MLQLFKTRMSQGYQTLNSIKNVPLKKRFRGRPVIEDKPCEEDCGACQDICPTHAIALNPVQIDLGKCVFCPECMMTCPVNKIRYTNDYQLATDQRDKLIVRQEKKLDSVKVNERIQSIFGRSLKLRSVSAGGCNGCELELNALGNVNFDMGRFGIEFTASPRHADGLVLTGPVSNNMSEALQATYDAIPEPKILIAVGACAISGGVFADSPALNRTFFDRIKIDLYIPGCPPHPLTLLNGILELLGRKYE